jgi:hypothetical protein
MLTHSPIILKYTKQIVGVTSAISRLFGRKLDRIPRLAVLENVFFSIFLQSLQQADNPI